MLILSDNPEDKEKPVNDHELPQQDTPPETEITEITPDPALPPALEQTIINDILNGPSEVLKMPSRNKPAPGKVVN